MVWSIILFWYFTRFQFVEVYGQSYYRRNWKTIEQLSDFSCNRMILSPMYQLLFVTGVEKKKKTSPVRSQVLLIKILGATFRRVKWDSSRTHFLLLLAMWHLSPHIGSWLTDQSRDATRVQLGEPVSCIGTVLGMRMRGYLQDQMWLKGNRIHKAHPLTTTGTWSPLPIPQPLPGSQPIWTGSCTLAYL